MKAGERVAGRVSALHPDGDARAETTDGAPLRVRGGVPGDEATFHVTHAGQHATWATVETVTAPSPSRVEAPCPVVLSCGACPWQMVSAEMQREARLGFLRDALGTLGESARWQPLSEAPKLTGYRTRALMPLRHRQGVLRMGFYAPRSQDLVPIDGACVAQDPRLNAALDGARKLLDREELGSWRGPDRPGNLRALAMRLDPVSGEGLLTILMSRPHGRVDAIGGALLALPHVAGVHICINPRQGGQLLRGALRRLVGASRMRLNFGDLELLAGPLAFVQTSHAGAMAMLERVASLAPERARRIVDLYAGIGVLGLSLRDRADAVVLVEEAVHAISDARANVSRLDAAEHVSVIGGDAGELARTVIEGGDGELVILDPPRAGCRPEVLRALIAKQPETILYASCHPRTFARDAEILCEAGYQLTDVAPIEMFPHTPHLELVAKLVRGG